MVALGVAAGVFVSFTIGDRLRSAACAQRGPGGVFWQ
jgi:hypothetical protein